MTWESVDLPEPFGPMMAWTSPSFTVSDSPWRISRSSTRTCKFLTSSSAISLSNLTLVLALRTAAARLEGRPLHSFPSFETTASRSPQDEALANRSFQRNRNQLLRFHRKFHRQLLQNVLHKAVD